MQAWKLCTICGDKLDRPHMTGQTICSGCAWDLLIPDDYQSREEYRLNETEKIYNATLRPLTGVGVLDLTGAPRIADFSIQLSERELERAGELEALVGLNESEYDLSEIKI